MGGMCSKKIGGSWSLPLFLCFILVADEKPAMPIPPDMVSCFARGTNLLGHGLEPQSWELISIFFSLFKLIASGTLL